jgi:bis(5'-nucleosyl)-tetraphosphatase (symmetrical)
MTKSPLWVVGDIQGCANELDRLLTLIAQRQANEPYEVWLCGDLVNRGPESLQVLRSAMNSPVKTRLVLGNHDFFLLACAAGARRPGRSDTIAQVLDASDASQLVEWLRMQPLALFEHGHLLVHAGVDPRWTASDTLRLAAEVEAELRGPNWRQFLQALWGNEPARFSEDLRGANRLRAVVNIFCRMRFCTPDGTQDFASKEGAGGAPAGYMPWFDVPGRATASVTTVFGHWSTFGHVSRPNLIGLDTGCVWGGKLTACKLHADWTRREFIQVQSGFAAPLK